MRFGTVEVPPALSHDGEIGGEAIDLNAKYSPPAACRNLRGRVLAAGEAPATHWRPGPIDVRAGGAYRFRIIGIMPQEGDFIELRDPAGIAEWGLIARDGVEGSSHRVPGLSAGMTLDYGLTASAPGQLVLEIDSIDLIGKPLHRPIRILVRVH